MNKEEILAMEAGRELDIQVGKHVFGWTDEKTEQNTLFEMSAKMWKPNDVYHCVPRYSTYMSVTWEVVEQMNDCLHLQEHGEQGEWQASFCGLDEKGHGETAQLAICRAALLAVIEP